MTGLKSLRPSNRKEDLATDGNSKWICNYIRAKKGVNWDGRHFRHGKIPASASLAKGEKVCMQDIQ